MMKDNSGRIWIGTFNGVNRYDPNAKSFVHLESDKEGRYNFKPYPKYCGLEDREGNIWIGTYGGGLIKVNSGMEEIRIYKKGQTPNTGFFSNYIFKVIEDNAGNIWVTEGVEGLIQFNPEEHSIKHFFADPNDPNSIAGNEIFGVEVDRDCNLWLAIPGKGLSMLPSDQQGASEPVFHLWSTENSNLPDNGVNDVFEDEQERIWVSSIRGVSQFDRATNTFLTYGPEVGMKTIPNRMIPSRDGGIYIRGPNGIGYFHPDQLAKNEHRPPVYLTDIQIDGQSLPLSGSPGDTLDFPSPLTHSITFTKEIRLRYDQNNLRLKFVALNYTAPERNQFKYQLIDYHDGWLLTNAINPYAIYINLDPGAYTFRVKGANNDGEWNQEGATLRIIITPPLWQTWWAYSLYAMVFFGIIFIIYRFLLRGNAFPCYKT